MIKSMDGMILDINTVSLSILGELTRDYPFEQVIADKRVFVKRLSDVIRDILIDSIVAKGAPYLRAQYCGSIIPEDRIDTLARELNLTKVYGKVLQAIIMNNFYLESMLDIIQDNFEIGHYEVWIIDLMQGIHVLTFMHDVRIQEWEEMRAGKYNPPF